MKRIWILLLIGFCSAISIRAQNYTAVSASVVDPNGNKYIYGSYNISLSNTTGQQPQLGGNPTFQKVYSGSLDVNGNLSISLPSVTVMTPSGLQWNFLICANPKQYASVFPQPSNPVCFTYTSTGTQISGTSVVITSSLTVTTIPGGATTATTANSVGGVFSFINYGAVDDDSTDNCANGSVAAFIAAVTAYSGPGIPVAIIPMGSAGKAYKLATSSASCHFEFDKSVALHVWGNIDCAQTAANCIQIGPTSGGVTTPAPTTIDGGGVMSGGASLTNAGIEIEPNSNNVIINGVHFINFGAGNATLGSCTNWAILIDNPVNEATVINNMWQITDSTANRCAFANTGGGSGFNTVFFAHNTLGGEGASLTCSSVGIRDGGSYGSTNDNNIFGFKRDIGLEGNGTYVAGNQLDTGTGSACASPSTNPVIQWGQPGNANVTGDFYIEGNKVGGSPNGSTVMFGRVATSTGTLRDVTLAGNIFSKTSALQGSGTLTDGSNCTTNPSNATQCYQYGNINFAQDYPCNTTAQGWTAGTGLDLAACASSGQTANLGATTAIASVQISSTYFFTCDIRLTTAATTSTLPQCEITYTDFYTNTAQTVIVTPVWASGTVGCNGSTTNTIGNSCSGSLGPFVPKAGTAVQYQTINYASSPANTMQYQASIRVIQH